MWHETKKCGRLFSAVIQVVYSRSNGFDRNGAPIMTVEEVMQKIEPAPLLWLNIQVNAFDSCS